MKKIVIPLLIVLASAATAAFFLTKHQDLRHIRSAALVPADTLFFAELPNAPRTALRWRQTALFQLWQEPEVQAFMEKPRTKMPGLADWQSKLNEFSSIDPRQAFVAITSWDANSVRWVAGFSFGGSRATVDKALAEPRAQLRQAWPAGKADLHPYGPSEIQTYTEKDNVIAETYRDDWYFVSNHVDLLRATLDRYDGKGDAKAGLLANDEVFQKSLKPLPADGEITAFGRVSVLTDRFSALMAAAGQKADAQQLAEVKKTQAVAFSTKMDGTQFRDTIFVYEPGAAKALPLPRRGLALSAATTMLYVAALLPEPAPAPAPAPSSPADAVAIPALAQLLPAFAEIEKNLAAKGLKFSDASAVFGPEINTLLDWPPATLQPSLLLEMDVRDATKAASFIEALTTPAPNAPAWQRQEKDGVTIFSPPATPAVAGLSLPQPAVALADKYLIVGLSADAVTTGAAQMKAGASKLSAQPAFQAAEKSVVPPTSAFGYLDLRALIERSYGILRPTLAMSLAFNPDSGQYIDAGKLPSGETLAKHLGASIFSQSVNENGSLFESTGALTFDQAIVAAVGSSGVAAFPMIEQTLQGGAIGFPQLLAPPAPPATQNAPAPAAPAPAAAPTPALPAAGATDLPARPAPPIPLPIPPPDQSTPPAVPSPSAVPSPATAPLPPGAPLPPPATPKDPATTGDTPPSPPPPAPAPTVQ